MHVTVDRKDLHTALDAAKKACARASSVRCLGQVLIQVISGYLVLIATDLVKTTMARIGRVIISAEGPHEALIDPASLIKLLKKSKAERVEMILDEDEVTFIFDDTRLTMPTTDPGEFPSLPAPTEMELVAELVFETQILQKALVDVLPSISTDETRPYLNGMAVQLIEDQVHLVSTDGHRMAIRRVEARGMDEEFAILVPRTAVQHLISQLRGKSLSAETTMRIYKGQARHQVQVCFEKDGVKYETWIRLSDSEFPPWQHVVPRPNGIHMEFDAQELAEATQQAHAFSTDRHRALHIIPNGVSVDIEVENPDLGTFAREIPAEITGQVPEKLGLNSQYVQDAIKAIGGECVTVYVGTSHLDGTLWRSDAGECEVVVMPVRV